MPAWRDLESEIADLYASEINCGLQTFWDGGMRVWIGDHLNGHKREQDFGRDEIGGAARWLHETAMQEYPESEYARARQ